MTVGGVQAEVEAIFVKTFESTDLATVSNKCCDNVESMRQVENAKTALLSPAIYAVDGAEGTSSSLSLRFWC